MTENQKLQLVGKAVKAADPDTAAMLRREDGITSLKGIGEYVLGCDPEQFDRIIEDHISDQEDAAMEDDRTALDRQREHDNEMPRVDIKIDGISGRAACTIMTALQGAVKERQCEAWSASHVPSVEAWHLAEVDDLKHALAQVMEAVNANNRERRANAL